MPTLPANFRDPDLLAFKDRFGLVKPSKFLNYTSVASGYGADFCHVSAKVQALKHGGKRVHGWSVWAYPSGLMAEFHSVWQNQKGTLVDVTPPKFGSTRVLFIPDPALKIYDLGETFLVPVNRMSPPNDPYWFNGNPHAGADWEYPKTNLSFVSYCATHGFSPADYATDDLYG